MEQDLRELVEEVRAVYDMLWTFMKTPFRESIEQAVFRETISHTKKATSKPPDCVLSSCDANSSHNQLCRYVMHKLLRRTRVTLRTFQLLHPNLTIRRDRTVSTRAPRLPPVSKSEMQASEMQASKIQASKMQASETQASESGDNNSRRSTRTRTRAPSVTRTLRSTRNKTGGSSGIEDMRSWEDWLVERIMGYYRLAGNVQSKLHGITNGALLYAILSPSSKYQISIEDHYLATAMLAVGLPANYKYICRTACGRKNYSDRQGGVIGCAEMTTKLALTAKASLHNQLQRNVSQQSGTWCDPLAIDIAKTVFHADDSEVCNNIDRIASVVHQQEPYDSPEDVKVAQFVVALDRALGLVTGVSTCSLL